MSAEQYFQLGLQEYQKNKFQRAVEAFNKSLAIKKSWQSYHGLGTALNGLKQYPKAVAAFNESLAMKKNWQSYHGLGTALNGLKQYPKAVAAFNESLAIKKNWQSHQGLGFALNKLGESKRAVLAAKAFYASKKDAGNINIDPLVGEKEGVKVGRSIIEKLGNMLMHNNFSFYPSYFSQDPESTQLESWKHLIHIHIPKCAGTSFERPLSSMVNYLKAYSSKRKLIESNKRNFLWHGNLKEKYLLDGYLMEIKSQNFLNCLQGSFFVDHGSGHGSYFKALAESGNCAKKICLTRDPSERLFSHIKHYGKGATDKEELRETCLKELSNVMHQFIYDHAMPHERDEFVYEQKRTGGLDSIEFIEISNANLIAKIKSSYLSANILPNIVQYHRLNDFDGDKDHKANFKDQDFHDIYNELIEQGFLGKDCRIDFESLHQKTKDKLKFPKLIDIGKTIHPITYIFRKNQSATLMFTKNFLMDPLGAINQE